MVGSSKFQDPSRDLSEGIKIRAKVVETMIVKIIEGVWTSSTLKDFDTLCAHNFIRIIVDPFKRNEMVGYWRS